MLYGPEYGVFRWISHMSLRRMCILLFVWRSSLQLTLYPLMVLLSLTVSLLIFCLLDLPISEKKDVDVSNYDNGFIYFSLQFWWFFASHSLLLYFRHLYVSIVVFFWRIEPFIIMQCPSLCLTICLPLKSVLSKINKALLAFYWLVLIWHSFL